jgi:hypothetical protein
MLLLLFQGSALVSRAEAGRDRLHAGTGAALDAPRQRWPNPGRLRAQGRPPGNQQPGGGAYMSRQTRH